MRERKALAGLLKQRDERIEYLEAELSVCEMCDEPLVQKDGDVKTAMCYQCWNDVCRRSIGKDKRIKTLEEALNHVAREDCDEDMEDVIPHHTAVDMVIIAKRALAASKAEE